MKLEKAIDKDLKDIAEIYKTEFSKPPYNEKWTSSIALKRIKEYYMFCDIWKLNYNGKIIGFIIINTKRWFPNNVCFGEEIAVKEDYQEKGLGTFIFKEIFRIYKERGFKKFAGITSKKSKALNLYNRLGIKESKDSVFIERNI